MKLEFPSTEGFRSGLICHKSMVALLLSAWSLRNKSYFERNGEHSSSSANWDWLIYHPDITDAADASILSVIRSLLDEERFFSQSGHPNKYDELQKLLTNFLKSHRPHRTKKPAKQPTP